MKNFVLILLIAIVSCNVSSDEIDATKVNDELKNLGNDLKLEEAEKYFQELISSKKNWCLLKYPDGGCKMQIDSPTKEIEETLNNIRSCVPVAKICSMEIKCKFFNVNEVEHPN